MWRCVTLALVTLVVAANSELYKNEFSNEDFIDSIDTYLRKDDVTISDGCKTQMGLYKEGLRKKKLWAWSMLDAGAKIPNGILEGNGGDLGVFDECLKVEGKTETGVIKGKYCLGSFKIGLGTSYSELLPEVRAETRAAALPLRLATCLPDACSAPDIQKIYSVLPFNVTYSEKDCQSKSSQPKLDGVAIGTIAFLGTMVFIMIISTIYDVSNHYTGRKSRHILLTAFSVFSNGKKLLKANKNPNSISCLHGLRTISMMWVILGHRYKTSMEMMSANKLGISEWIGDFANTFVMGGAVAVDTFLLLSGLVISYSYMIAKSKGVRFNIFQFYLHRYLRLTPAYAAVILINVSLMKHLSSGPQWPQQVDNLLEAPCRKYWWSALLYVQNYVNPADPCMGQTWYLSVDTQLFFLSPLLLIPFYKWPKLRPFVLFALAFASALAAFLISYFEELSLAIGFGDPDRQQDYITKIYYPAYTRAAPWLIGFGAGYLLYASGKTKPVFRSPGLRTALWIGTLAVLFVCVGGSYFHANEEIVMFWQAAYVGFISPSWSLAVSSLILLCFFGYGGPINWLLSNHLMQVLSKLTYSMYILHKLVLSIYIYSARTGISFNNFDILHAFWGDFIYTLALAVIWVLAFESPVVEIEKLMFGGSKKAPTKEASSKKDEAAEAKNNI